MEDIKKVKLKCPCCQGDVVADIETGEIFYHKKQKKETKEDKPSMKSLLEEVSSHKNKVLNRFEQEKVAIHKRRQVLDDIFNESLKNVKKPE